MSTDSAAPSAVTSTARRHSAIVGLVIDEEVPPKSPLPWRRNYRRGCASKCPTTLTGGCR